MRKRLVDLSILDPKKKMSLRQVGDFYSFILLSEDNSNSEEERKKLKQKGNSNLWRLNGETVWITLA